MTSFILTMATRVFKTVRTFRWFSKPPKCAYLASGLMFNQSKQLWLQIAKKRYRTPPQRVHNIPIFLLLLLLLLLLC